MRGSPRTLFAALAFALLATAITVSAQPPGDQPSGGPTASGDADARIDELRVRARRLEEVRGHEAAEDALQHARRAILTARDAARRNDAAGFERAIAIAQAALTLADRAAARRRAHDALEAARVERTAAETRAEAAREALSRAIRDRDGEG
ncbi:MAG: hypothetical protein AB7S26_05035 [Sandaracinaceae bacterium]